MSKKSDAGRPLPAWMDDESMLRRILLMRRDGRHVKEIQKSCSITCGQWSRVRTVAREGVHIGDKAVADAFFTRFDAVAESEPLFSPSRGKRRAHEIEGWKLDGPAMTPADAEEEA